MFTIETFPLERAQYGVYERHFLPNVHLFLLKNDLETPHTRSPKFLASGAKYG